MRPKRAFFCFCCCCCCCCSCLWVKKREKRGTKGKRGGERASKKEKRHVDVEGRDEWKSSYLSLSPRLLSPFVTLKLQHQSKSHVPAPRRGRQARAETPARVGRATRWCWCIEKKVVVDRTCFSSLFPSLSRGAVLLSTRRPIDGDERAEIDRGFVLVRLRRAIQRRRKREKEKCFLFRWYTSTSTSSTSKSK